MTDRDTTTRTRARAPGVVETPPNGGAHTKPDPRLDPTRLRGALSNERPYRDLRNVDANYLFERSHRFAGIQPNSGFGDYSRLSCGVGNTQLGVGQDLGRDACGRHQPSSRGFRERSTR